MSSESPQPGVKTTPPAGLFGSLPKELLEQIYVRSESVELPLVNHHFYQSLSHNFIRIWFCAQVFYHGREPNGLYPPDHLGMAPVQTRIFQRKWLSNNLEKKVESEVIRLQRGNGRVDRFQDGVKVLHLRPKDRVQIAFSTTIPKELLKGTWTHGKVRLLTTIPAFLVL